MGIKDKVMNSLGFQDQPEEEYQYEDEYEYEEPGCKSRKFFCLNRTFPVVLYKIMDKLSVFIVQISKV